MFCRYCGTKIPDTAKFCKNCGKATTKQKKSNEQFTNQDSENKENQNNVFVNKKDDNTFGIYNVKDNKYKKLYLL